jgi:hypothetical protein
LIVVEVGKGRDEVAVWQVPAEDFYIRRDSGDAVSEE